MNKEETILKLKAIIKPFVNNEEAFENMSETTDFITDLNINSANIVDIILDVEEAFSITIDNQSMEKMLTINATLEAAAKVNSPVIIQFSNGGAQFIAGKGMPNDNLQANISGGVSGALHIHNVAKYYGVPVVLHTDHASKKWLPWVSGLIDAGEQFYKEKGQP